MIHNNLLVPFLARRLATASVAMVNRKFELGDDTYLLDRFAWLIPSDLDKPEHFHDGHKTFYAERYGGLGLVTHGGGVRCGLDGEYQVKGLGCNPLVGEGAEFWHSHGGATMDEAIREAIWGEVFHHALPYSAVRVPAIIATGTECWAKGGNDEKITVPRALIVREAALRPGHFERSIYFRPSKDIRKTIPHDTERVRAAIGFLPEALPLPPMLMEDAARLDRIERLHAGLAEMVRRFAEQAAAAKAKRLMHGAIVSSNICLDGRWLDYGSVTALPGYGDVKDYSPFWEDQHNGLLPVLANLCFYIGKYFPAEDKARLLQPQWLIQEFDKSYQAALLRRFVLLAGFPEILLTPHWPRPEVRRLATAIIAIARSGQAKPHRGFPDDDSRFGDYKLGNILLALARWYDDAECDARLAPFLTDIALRTETIVAYRAFAKVMVDEAATQGITAISLRRLTMLNAAKCAKTIPLLYRHRLVEHTRQLVKENPRIDDLRLKTEALLNDLADQASVVYQDTLTYTTLCWKNGDTCIHYDASRDQWRLDEAGQSITLPWVAIHKARGADASVCAMRNYWGEALGGC